MTPEPRTENPEGASEPPELAPVEQSLRARLTAMSFAELEALAVALKFELARKEPPDGE